MIVFLEWDECFDFFGTIRMFSRPMCIVLYQVCNVTSSAELLYKEAQRALVFGSGFQVLSSALSLDIINKA